MKVNKVFFRTAGAVGIALVTLTAGAQEVKKESSALATTINVAEGPSLPATPKHKTTPTVAPARANAAPTCSTWANSK